MVREAEATGGAKVAGGIKALVPFMGEMLLTKGLFTGSKKATEKGLTKLFKNAVEEGVEQGLKRKALGLGIKTTGSLVGSGARTLAMPQRVLASALDRSISLDAEGKISIEDPSIVDGFLDTYIENVSEEAGAALLGVPSKVLSKVLGKTKVGSAMLSGLDNIATKWKLKNPKGTASQFSKFLKAGGKGTFIEEIAEGTKDTREVTDEEKKEARGE